MRRVSGQRIRVSDQGGRRAICHQRSFIDWAKWEPGFKAAGAGIAWIKGLLGDLVYRAIAAADVLGAVLSGDWERAKFAAGEFMNGRPADATNPTGGGGGQAAALAYFQGQGWSQAQAAGLAANISRESAYNPAAVGDNGKAYGIGQWHPDRQAEFKRVFGKPIQGSTFDEQLAFMQYELTKGNEKRAGDILRGTTTAADAAAAVSNHYERPADRAGEAARRGQLATSMLGGIPGASVAASGAGASQVAQAASVQVGGNSSSTVSNHIGEVTVYSAATDAEGIARDMGPALDYLFTAQANYGLD